MALEMNKLGERTCVIIDRIYFSEGITNISVTYRFNSIDTPESHGTISIPTDQEPTIPEAEQLLKNLDEFKDYFIC